MDINLLDIAGILSLIVLFLVPYYLFYRLLRFKTIPFIKRRITASFISITVITAFYFFLLTNSQMGCGSGEASSRNKWVLEGAQGKLAIEVPDTLIIFKKDKVIIRIAKLNLNNDVFLEHIQNRTEKILITDTLLLSSVMRVSLKEISEENKVEIVQLNNNEKQFIDTSKYTEWTFGIRAIDYGRATLVVSISGLIKTEFGNDEIDFPIYEKEISIFAAKADKFRVFWRKYNWISIIVVFGVFLLLYKLIPNQTIIDYYMPNSKKTNFWNAGALGLVVYLITIASIVLFKIVEISLFYVPLVFIGTVLIYAVFTAVSLRDNERLSEDNFIKLMTMAIKKLPPLNLIFREKKVE